MVKLPTNPAPPGTDHPIQEALEGALPQLRAFTRRICRGAGATSDGDDIAQDTVERALRYRDSWDPSSPILPWLLRTAWRVAIDARNAQSRQPGSTDGAPGLDAEAVGQPRHHRSRGARDLDLEAVDHREDLEFRLRGLSALERALLLGLHRDSLSIADLAHTHALPQGTVKSLLHRARAKLRTS